MCLTEYDEEYTMGLFKKEYLEEGRAEGRLEGRLEGREERDREKIADMLRRGKPTTHAVYGEAMGILAGDGLLNYAFEIMADALSEMEPSLLPGALRAFSILSHAAGSSGMIGGQCVDVEAEGREEISDELIDTI